jgi:hypothetical protein
MRHARIVLLGTLAIGLAAGPAWAHGTAGKRFFPATLTIEDPFVALAAVRLAHQGAGGEGDVARRRAVKDHHAQSRALDRDRVPLPESE